MQRPQTENERVIDRLVNHRERLEESVAMSRMAEDQLALFLDETLGNTWKQAYYIWQHVNAKELNEWRKNYKEMWGM